MPFLGGKIGISGAHRQPVRFSDDRAGHDPRAEFEIGSHSSQDDRLLSIFPAKKGQIRPDDIEQDKDDRRYPAEMSGARPAAQLVLKVDDFDERLVSGRIDFGGIGKKKAVDSLLFEEGPVSVDTPGVFLEILRGPELGRIDEDADNRDVGSLPGFTDETQVSLVEETHGGDEADDPALALPRPGKTGHFFRLSENLHFLLYFFFP